MSSLHSSLNIFLTTYFWKNTQGVASFTKTDTQTGIWQNKSSQVKISFTYWYTLNSIVIFIAIFDYWTIWPPSSVFCLWKRSLYSIHKSSLFSVYYPCYLVSITSLIWSSLFEGTESYYYNKENEGTCQSISAYIIMIIPHLKNSDET